MIELEKYWKSYYCGLCKRSFPILKPFIINESVLISILFDSQNIYDCNYYRMFCPLQIGLRKYCSSRGIELGYLFNKFFLIIKVIDYLSDDLNIKNIHNNFLFNSLIIKIQKKIIRDYFKIDLVNYYKKQWNSEKKCDYFSWSEGTEKLVGDIFKQISEKSNIPSNNFDMERIGKHVGRLLYLYDQIVDYKKDIKKGKINPLLYVESKENFIKDEYMHSLTIINESFQNIHFNNDMSYALIMKLLYHDIEVSFRNIDKEYLSSI